VENRPQASTELQEEEGGKVQMNQTANNVDVEVRNMLEYSTGKIGRRLKQFVSQWQCIATDPFILNSVKHYKIEFGYGEPKQPMPPKEIHFTQQEQKDIDNETRMQRR